MRKAPCPNVVTVTRIYGIKQSRFWRLVGGVVKSVNNGDKIAVSIF